MKNRIDISTEEKRKEIYEIFNSLTSKNKIHEYFNISDNKNGSEYIKQIANEIGFDLNVYKECKKKYCLQCGKELKKGQNKFCSSSCAATYNNIKRGGHSDETKKKISESLKNKYDIINSNKTYYKHSSNIKNKDNKLCCICGQLECIDENVCKHSKKWFDNLVCFCFNIEKIGTLDVYDEFYKIKKMFYDEYVNNKLSVCEIKEKYGYDWKIERLVHVLKNFDIKLRTYSDAVNNALINGRLKPNNFYNQYKCGWHETWYGKKVFLRSSYEFDYASKLDDNKIKYDVECFRIKYFDTISKRYRIAIPDFYLNDTNTLVEIKSDYTYNKENMDDKFKEYKKLGFNTKLILEHIEYDT